MEYNVNELLKMSNEDLLEFMQGISHEEKRIIWNAISDESVDRIRSFEKYLKSVKIPVVREKGVHKGETVLEKAYNVIYGKIHRLTIIEAWDNERALIRQGKGTRNWTKAEQEIILNSTDYPPLKKALGIQYDGQHMYSKAEYPEFACKSENIQFLETGVHIDGAHNGNTVKNQTHGYYEELFGKMYDFKTKGIDDGIPPVIQLTEVCDEVLGMDSYKNAFRKDYSKIIPNYDKLTDDNTKILAQKFEHMWSVKRGKDSKIPYDFEEYIAYINADGAMKSSDDICEKLAMKLFDETGGNKKLIEKISIMSKDDAVAFMSKNSFYKNKIAKLLLPGGDKLGIVHPGVLEFNEMLTNIKADLFNAFRKDDSLKNLLKNGGTAIVTASDILDFIEVSIDIYYGLKNNTMTERQAGEALTETVFAVAFSEVGASAGTTIGAGLLGTIFSIGGPIGTFIGTVLGGIAGGLIGGVLGYFIGGIIGGEFYDQAYSDAFKAIDGILTDGQRFLEGTKNNDYYNFAGTGKGGLLYPEMTYDIEGYDGNDYIAGYGNDDRIVGGQGFDMLVGCGGNDTIYGDETELTVDGGDDIIYGGSGNDELHGGPGDDIIYGDGVESNEDKWGTNPGVFRFPKELMFTTIVFNPYCPEDTTYDDTIYGEHGNDYLYGGRGTDHIYGGYGDDVIYGENDDDFLYGDTGNDYIVGGNGSDHMEGGIGDDYLYGGGTDTYGAYDEMYGQEGDDVIRATKSSKLVGGAGDDIITGSYFNDRIFGDEDDYEEYFSDGNDDISAGDGYDYIHGGGGNDIIRGGNDNDIICGDSGDDELHGDDGNDSILGGSGEDTIYGGNGVDTIFGDADNDLIYGGEDNDTINGGEGDDVLYGDAGNDKIYGSKGNDIINGGSGNDTLEGGEGNDSFYFGYGYGNDTIYDKYGISHIELGEIDIEDIVYETAENGHDLIFSFESSPEDVLTILDFDELRENYYFWIDDESYQIDENGDLIQKEPPHSGGGGSSNSRGSFLDDIKHDTIPKIGDQFDEAGKVQPPRDPLIIDLNGDGVHTTTVEDGVYFDIDNNGFAEKTAWIDTIDGFLVYNRDDDPKITNGSELFSDQVIFPDDTKSTDGFDVLQRFDTNGDNVVNINDAAFDALMVWIDKNHDGVTYFPVSDTEEELAKKELFSLEELGITSISTVPQSPEGEPEDSPNKELFAHVMINGDEHTISEHWFEAITSDTQELHTEGIDDDLTSFGNLHSISYALDPEHDTDGYLNSLYDRFKVSDDYAEKRILVKKILYRISGAENIAMNSRGSAIDARDLHVIETIMGVERFIGAGNSLNPNSNAAAILKEVYNKFETLYFVLLNDSAKSSTYLDLIEERYNENNEKILNVEFIKQLIDDRIENNEATDEMLCSVGIFLKAYDNANSTNYFKTFKQEYSAQNEYFARMADANFVLGTDNGESINGSYTNDVFYVEGGNDTVHASNGDDVIYGGDGNDTLNAGSGNDIAYGGSGDDTINGDAGNDVMYGEEGNDTLNGGAGNDSLYTGEGDDTLNGGDGDDVLYGAEGNDALDGGEGNDTLYGGDGNDTISGGTGDDILDGGAGDDTYYINAEHGNDTIIDSEGLTTIVFGDEISADSYDLNIDINSGITLVNNETGETIGLPDFINVPENYEFTFDGESKILGGGETRQVIEGTDGDDTITASDGFNIIRGGEGNDTITGGDNLNFIYGGEGDDTITGGNGTNIIHGDEGNDTITDGSGSSYIDGGDGDDVIHAGEGNDIIIGGAGADQLYGEDGDDVIAGNAGNDEIYGGNGDDTVYADAGNDIVHGGVGNDSLFGGNGYDTLYGDEGDDYLEAGNGEDTLYGGEGNDVLVGGTGVNKMYGEDGNDTFYGGNALNYLYGGNGDDNFTGGNLADHIEGGAGNDTMNGGNGSNEMYGGDGDDYIYGGNDDDYIEGGNGDDHLYGGNGVNTIYGGAGNDIIFDGDNNSFLYGGDGDDEIRAGGGSDVLDGGAGNDYLQSDHGGDTYVFGIGYDIDTISASADLNTILIHGYMSADMHNSRMANNDLLIDFGKDTGDKLIVQGFFDFNSNRDFNFVFDDETVLGQYDIQAVFAPIYGTDADEWLSVQGNDDGVIHAGAGNDGLSGGSGNDELYGEDGDDTLYGNDGNDILDGGTGNDQLNGGNGEDTYIFAKGYAQDSINEWGSDHSIVELADINSDEITVSDQWGSNLLISVNDTEDVLTISNFKWGQSTFTFRFADGAEGYVDRETWQLVLTKQPDEIEDTEQMGAELLESLYEDDTLMSDLLTEDSSTVITNVTESTVLDGDNADISDMTDIQAMLLAENMSAFGNDDQVYDSMNITDITADTSLTDSLLVGSLQ